MQLKSFKIDSVFSLGFAREKFRSPFIISNVYTSNMLPGS